MGMTNRDWLFSLPLEEQIAWMESEHYEPNPNCSAMLYRMYTENMKHEPCNDYEPKDDVSGYGADFNVAEPNFDNIKAVEMDASRFEAVEMDASRLVVREPDTREKLEADIWYFIEHNGWFGYEYEAESYADCRKAIFKIFKEWLDRQSAITERECKRVCDTCNWPDAANNQRLIAMRETDRNAELQEQVYELTAELKNWKANCDDWKEHARAADNACYETMLEREEYRLKFDKCIDHADAIHALMDDEGLA